FVFSSRRRHTSCSRDWSSDVCSSDLLELHGDSVQFTVNAELPPKMMKKKVVYSLVPEYQYSGNSYPLADSITFDGDEINRKEAEIGRASCRERVEFSEVGGPSISKNN